VILRFEIELGIRKIAREREITQQTETNPKRTKQDIQ
jgi:hypothetical protein